MARPMAIIDFDKIYYNSQNIAFKIVKELDPTPDNTGRLRRMVLIKFIESGYEVVTHLSRLQSEPITITDYLSPSVYGVGMVGYASPKLNKNMYKRWADMLSRCYNPDDDRYNAYGAKGVRVCERWKRFDFFLEDIVKLPGYQDMINNPATKYQLDKDILQQGVPANQKVYSPETCMFVPEIQNNIQRIIDNKPNCINNQYYGVQITEAGTYSVRIRDGYENVNCGTYDDIIAAANAYNHFAIALNKTLLNDVMFMEWEECVKHLIRPLEMLVDYTKTYGVKQLKNGNHMIRMSVNGNQSALGIYTYRNAALNEYNYLSFGMGRPILNKVPFMSREECSKYLVNPRVMCTIVN